MKYRIGVDVGGTAIKAGVIDENNNIVSKLSAPTDNSKSFEEVIKNIADYSKDVVKKAGFTLDDFPCVGIGMPSFINPNTGLLVFSNNMGWRNVPIISELKKHISIPIYVGNDANCAVIGETIAGAAKGKDNVLMLTLGTGVGGGIIINGKLFDGGDGMGAELGHMGLILDGELCTCGMKGCIEAYASVTGLISQTKTMMELYPDSKMHEYAKKEGKISGRTAFETSKLGDKPALEVVETYINYLAASIGSLVTVFRPDIVLIGGGLSNQDDYLLDPLNKLAENYTFAADIIGMPKIIKAELGNDAGIIGAAYLDIM